MSTETIDSLIKNNNPASKQFGYDLIVIILNIYSPLKLFAKLKTRITEKKILNRENLMFFLMWLEKNLNLGW